MIHLQEEHTVLHFSNFGFNINKEKINVSLSKVVASCLDRLLTNLGVRRSWARGDKRLLSMLTKNDKFKLGESDHWKKAWNTPVM